MTAWGPAAHVQPTTQAREELAKLLDRFREQGPFSAPLIFGRHRKAEGAVIPYELFELLQPMIEDLAVTHQTAERLQRADERRRCYLMRLLLDLG